MQCREQHGAMIKAFEREREIVPSLWLVVGNGATEKLRHLPFQQAQCCRPIAISIPRHQVLMIFAQLGCPIGVLAAIMIYTSLTSPMSNAVLGYTLAGRGCLGTSRGLTAVAPVMEDAEQVSVTSSRLTSGRLTFFPATVQFTAWRQTSCALVAVGNVAELHHLLVRDKGIVTDPRPTLLRARRIPFFTLCC